MRLKTHSQKGFTVLETMVAAGVSGAIIAAAAPNLATMLSAASLQSELRSTAQYVRLARATAVGKNQTAQIVVNGGTLTMQVSPDGTTWTNTGTPLVLGSGTTVSSISPNASALSFTNQGTTSSTVTITLQTTRGDTKSLVVSILGSVDPA